MSLSLDLTHDYEWGSEWSGGGRLVGVSGQLVENQKWTPDTRNYLKNHTELPTGEAKCKLRENVPKHKH